MRPLAVTCAVGLALAAAACGNERVEFEPLRIGPDSPVERVKFPRVGLSVSVPRDAELERRPRPGVFRLLLGRPIVSVFAYRRKEQIPRGPSELRAARRRLIKQVERRDRRFRLQRSELTRVAGARAVELVGEQVISGGRVRTRSVHVYKKKAEYVIELLAPPRGFARANRGLFEPMLRSLRLTGVVKPAERSRKK